MSRITDTELKNYYSEISSGVICSRKQKNAFMKELKSNIDEYIATEPDATIESITFCFGTPDQIAESFIGNSEPAKIKKKMDIKKYLILAMIIALLIYLAFVIISLVDVHTEAHGYIKEGILVIAYGFKGGLCL